jgi:hypothetical protein
MASEPNDKKLEAATGNPDLSNVLAHIKSLEQAKSDLELKLKETEQRAERMSVKTRESMQSAMDTLMKKWMDAVDTKDEVVKTQFKTGLDKLVTTSAEENGVWQMMVAASALHDRQEHNLEKLRVENNELRSKVDTMFTSPESRVVGHKSKAADDLSRAGAADVGDCWAQFERAIQSEF